MFRSLRSQLVVLILGVLGLAFVLLVVTSRVVFDRLFAEYEGALAARRVDTIAGAVKDAWRRDGDWRGAKEQVPYFCMMLGACVKIVDAKGAVPIDYCVNADPASGTFGTLRDEDSAVVPLAVDGRQIGTLLINTALHRPVTGAPVGVLRTSIGWSILLTGLLSVLVALAVGFVFSRRLTAPVEILTGAAGRITAGDLSTRVQVDSRDEIGTLASAFNAMSEAVRLNEELRRKLVEDVAHELRTPLAAMQCVVEGMQDGVVKVDGDSLRSLHEELSSLTRTVSGIGALSWAESKKLTRKPQRTDVAGILRKLCGKLDSLYAAKGLAVLLEEKGAPVEPAIDREMTERALENVLENACKYSPRGGEVRIAVEYGHGAVAIAISDAGPGIEAGDLPRIFERFYRAPGEEKGTGIGLAAAKELITAQGGTITAESAPGKGSTFTVRLGELS